MAVITLPWPDKRLSPNARVFYMALAKVKKAAKAEAFWITAEQTTQDQRGAIAASEGHIPLKVTFHPPDKRHRDDDNAVASFKAARDGIAAAIGVDDKRFRAHYFFAEPEKPGRVVVEFSGLALAELAV